MKYRRPRTTGLSGSCTSLLDSYSIQAVGNCIDGRLQKQIGHIPRSAGMGFVTTPEIYDGLQEAIRLVAKGESSANCA